MKIINSRAFVNMASQQGLVEFENDNGTRFRFVDLLRLVDGAKAYRVTIRAANAIGELVDHPAGHALSVSREPRDLYRAWLHAKGPVLRETLLTTKGNDSEK